MNQERQVQDQEEISIDPLGCGILILMGAFGISATAIAIGVAIGLATGKLPTKHDTAPTPAPHSVGISSFENSFNLPLQLAVPEN